jgi:two-component system nitrogen regulation response regulator NtrX
LARKASLLILDDEPGTLASLSRAFRLAGHEATVCDNANKALELAKVDGFDLIFSDVVMPGKDGLAFLEELRAGGVTTPVVMMSGQAHIEMAVRATKLGALDFLEKPISTEKLLLTVDNALRLQRLESENRRLRQRLGDHEIIFTGEAMKKVMAQVDRVAPTETRVCILGETGTGKELVARALHEKSPRKLGPFVAVNCAAVPAELIESELFGHEKGSFTGATARHVGKFEQADHGTLFLDEIGDMSLALQAKILRVLQEREVERVGGAAPVRVDVRLIAATHRDLERDVRDGRFREDLYYRLAVVVVQLPPLRERGDDLRILIEHYLRRYAREYARPVDAVSTEAIAILRAYSWPGNVRQLRNVIESAVLLADTDVLLPCHLPPEVMGQDAVFEGRDASALVTLSELERRHIQKVLAASGGQMSVAAEILGIHRNTLRRKLAEYGIG